MIATPADAEIKYMGRVKSVPEYLGAGLNYNSQWPKPMIQLLVQVTVTSQVETPSAGFLWV